MQLKNIIGKDNDPLLDILDVEVPVELETAYPSGIAYLDDALGGEGFTPSTVMMLTGNSGAGKTTLSLTLADAMTGQGNCCLVNTAEEALFQVRKTTRRLGIKNGFYVGQNVMVEDIIKQSKLIMKKNKGKQFFLIVDSLPCLNDGKYGEHTNSNTPTRVTEMLGDFAKEKYLGQYPVVIIINHVTKGKNPTFIGKNTIKHILDAHMHLKLDENQKSETFGKILLQSLKNRFGGCHRDKVLEMTNKGLVDISNQFYGAEKDESEDEE